MRRYSNGEAADRRALAQSRCEMRRASASLSCFTTSVAPNGQTSVFFSEFGMRSDGVTPRTEAELHIVVHNDDSEGTGVEIWHSVHY